LIQSSTFFGTLNQTLSASMNVSRSPFDGIDFTYVKGA
jgi:hypothetical protein